MATLSQEEEALLETLGIDKETLHGALRAGLDSNSIASGWLDGSEAFRKKYNGAWDESAFASNRDGSQTANVPSFQIDAAPDHGNDVIEGLEQGQDQHFSYDMSRPPSRNQTRSPIGGPVTKEQEEEDFQRALRESANEAGLDAIQESGVTSAVFGPATREYYEQDQWAVVRHGLQASTISHSLPSARKRQPGAPALLYSEGNDHDFRLGGFLTVLSEIPLARNALLQLPVHKEVESVSSDWWKGQPIVGGDYEAFLQYIQCLMGACDSSERSFFSTHTIGEVKSSSSFAKNAGFFESIVGSGHQTVLRPLLHNTHTFTIKPSDDLDNEGGGHLATQLLFQTSLPSIYHKNNMNLYEVLDHHFWSGVLGAPNFPSMDSQDMKTLSQVGEVFVIQCDPPSNASSTAKLTIPAYFYPERYLEARKEDAMGFQYLWKKTKRHVLQVADPTSPSALPAVRERVARLNARLQASEAGLEFLDLEREMAVLKEEASQLNLSRNNEDASMTDPQQRAERQGEILRQLKQVQKQTKSESAKTELRLRELEDRLKQFVDVEDFLTSLLTDPNGDVQGYADGLSKKYLLRGVIVSNGDDASATIRAVYVCKRSESLIDLGGPSTAGDDWWRLDYVKDGNPMVKAKIVAVDEVLNAARDMPNPAQAIVGLVYASEDALDVPKIPVPGPIQRFLKLDQRRFYQELLEEESGPQQNAAALPPMSRPPTPSSLNTDRGSEDIDLSSRDGDFDNEIDPFADQDIMSDDRVTEIHMEEVENEDTFGVAPSHTESPILGRNEMAATADVQVTTHDGGHEPPPYSATPDIRMGGMTPDTEAPVEEMKDVSTKPLFLARKDASDKQPSMEPPEGS